MSISWDKNYRNIKMNKDLHDLAAEIWALAQTPPGGLVLDSIDRIYLRLKEELPKIVLENKSD